MSWGEVEPEARDWYLGLHEEAQGRASFHIDRLAELGPLMDEPHTRQLDGKLRELRFFLAGRPVRVTYWIASGRRIILLTAIREDSASGARRGRSSEAGDGAVHSRGSHDTR